MHPYQCPRAPGLAPGPTAARPARRAARMPANTRSSGPYPGPRGAARHRQHRLANVVEQEHAVIKSERKVGNAPIIGGNVGKLLGVANGVVRRKTNRSAHEPRQAFHGNRAITLNELFEIAKRISRPKPTRWSVVVRSADDRVVAAGLELQKRLCAQKAEPADLLATHNALEQKGEAAAVDQSKRRDRCQPIARQLAPHRNARRRADERKKLFKRRAIAAHERRFPPASAVSPTSRNVH